MICSRSATRRKGLEWLLGSSRKSRFPDAGRVTLNLLRHVTYNRGLALSTRARGLRAPLRDAPGA